MNYNFFESLDAVNFNRPIWSKNLPAFSQSDKVIHEGNLWKISRKGSKEYELGYFCIRGKTLLFRNPKEHPAYYTSAMDLEFAQMRTSTEKSVAVTNYSIKLKLRGKNVTLWARDKTEFNEWTKKLSTIVVRTDFHVNYAVTDPLGSGGFAEVYAAYLKEAPDQKFAVKGFNKSKIALIENGKIALWNEINIMRALSNRNLLSVVEVHETANSVYLVMEQCVGDLRYLRKSRIGSQETVLLSIVYGIAKALRYLSQKQIVHRDLKPSNVMLRKLENITPDDVVVV